MGETSRSNQSVATSQVSEAESRPREPRSVRWSAGFVAWAARVAAALALIAGVALPINQLTQTGGTVWVSTDISRPPINLPEGSSLEFSQPRHSVKYLVHELPWWLRLLTETSPGLGYLSLGIGAVMVRRLVLTIDAGRPFDRRNPRRIGVIAVCVAVGLTGAAWFESFAAWAVVGHVAAVSDTPSLISTLGAHHPRLDLAPVVVAAAIAVVAIAFRRGQQLTKDVEGLV
ncbi:DUF2975 domain-containing protein [Actinopolymorpha pittospori]